MIQIIVQAQKASCRKSPGEQITTGMVGKKVTFDFSAEWDGLVKTAVFEGSGAAKDVVLNGASAAIPHECLTVPGGMLRVGVFGIDGTMQTPTIYTDIGQIERGADPSGDESADPTLPIWAQLQAMMGDLGNLTTTAKENLVAAINEAAKSGGGGGGTAADVKMQVDGGYIQYSTDGGESWNNLIAMADLIGPTGPAGPTGATGATGASGEPGKDGGYYTPEISQPDENTMRVAFTPSDSSMPAVESQNVTLPAGPAGADGAPGSDGAKGADGKSAYQYAVEGGYTGTEEEFAAKLAAEFPDKLPNPNALTFSGAVTGSYDGSKPLEVNIPSGGGIGAYLPYSFKKLERFDVETDVSSLVINFETPVSEVYAVGRIIQAFTDGTEVNSTTYSGKVSVNNEVCYLNSGGITCGTQLIDRFYHITAAGCFADIECWWTTDFSAAKSPVKTSKRSANVENISSISFQSQYKYNSGIVNRIAAGSYMEVWYR